MKLWYLSALLMIGVFLLSCSQSGKKPKKQKQNKEQSIHKDVPIKVTSSVLQQVEAAQETTNTDVSLSGLYERAKNAVFLIYTSDGENMMQGSGFFITDSGIGISNYHVFKGTYKGKDVIKVLSGEQYKIDEVLAANEDLDYIVFKVRVDRGVSFVPIATEVPQVGQDVFAIGNPEGLESTLSKGIISGLRPTQNLIQTTAEITHGSSGGALFNMKGEVLGITSSGLGEANLNFAIDIRALHLIK